MPGPADEVSLSDSISEVKARLLAGLQEPVVVDLAFIGNTSAVYDWTPCQMVDLDCFLFARELDERLGSWLLGLRDTMAERLEARNISFEVRIVEGPYKPSMSRLDRPVIVAHLGVFTEETYLRSPALKRWAWRKYRCEREAGRLRRYAPAPPDLDDFVYGPKGLDERLAAMRAGAVRMTEWLLPSLATRSFEIRTDDVAFQECCFAYCANSARNHARALGFLEADSLGNADFFLWYDRSLFRSEALLQLMRLKARCRDTGFDLDTDQTRRLALAYLEGLRAALGG